MKNTYEIIETEKKVIATNDEGTKKIYTIKEFLDKLDNVKFMINHNAKKAFYIIDDIFVEEARDFFDFKRNSLVSKEARVQYKYYKDLEQKILMKEEEKTNKNKRRIFPQESEKDLLYSYNVVYYNLTDAIKNHYMEHALIFIDNFQFREIERINFNGDCDE